MGNKDKGKKSAMKSGTAGAKGRGVISSVRAFEGPHPDAGTMRMIIQGVQEQGGKIQAIMHPDTTFTGARANLLHVLGLEKKGGSMQSEVPGHGGARSVASAAHSALHHDGEAHPDHTNLHTHFNGGATTGHEASGHHSAHDHVHKKPSGPIRASPSPVPGAGSQDDVDGDDSEAGSEEERNGARVSDGGDDGDGLHRKAANQSDFVAQWVRTISKQVSGGAGEIQAPGDGADAPSALRPVPEDEEDVDGLLSLALPRQGSQLGAWHGVIVCCGLLVMHAS